MKKATILVGSNHRKSINLKLAQYAASLLSTNFEVNVFSHIGLDIPMYGIDVEKENGFPEIIKKLSLEINQSDVLILVSPEHNGMIPAVFKNTLDWLSRLEKKFLGNKPTLLMGTSPGSRGAKGNLAILEQVVPRWGAELVGTFSLPSFNENFSTDFGMKDPYETGLKNLIERLQVQPIAQTQ